MTKVRVRGIYSTALTKLLINHGFSVVQPSAVMQERFGLEENNEQPDISITDRQDRQGIQVLGKIKALEEFKSTLQSQLNDVVTRECAFSIGGIYKGLIIGSDSKTQSTWVNIGPAMGRILQERTLESKQLIVQVEGMRQGIKEPILTTKIKIPGKYVVLISECGVKVSRRIRDWRKRSRLYRLGQELAPPKWGILWRTASADQPFQVLKDEVTSLVRRVEDIMAKAERVEAPALLEEGTYFMDVEFPAISKERLDEIRMSVIPTIKGHHYFKACGGKISSVLEMAEKMLERGYSHDEVMDLFEQTIAAEYPKSGSVIRIEHVKLDGKVFHLGKALVEAYDRDESTIRLRRSILGMGLYDGLKVRKEAGDHAITEARAGELHLKTSYYSRDGHYKGTYININTPVELYPHGIRYIDLEVDICIWPDGKVQVIDEDKLREASIKGLINDKLMGLVEEEVHKLLSSPPTPARWTRPSSTE
ncbi:MAG: DUF402 domain-containing protein [Candidatus Freyarchaeota archaeon]